MRAGPSAAWWFVLAAFGWTWTLGFTAVALGGTPGRVLHLLALLGPLLAWLGVLLAHSGRAGRAAFLGRVLHVRAVRPVWWLAIVAVGAGPAGVATGAVALAGGDAGFGHGMTVVGLLGVLGFAVAAGVAEEPGWRGIAQDATEPHLGRWRSAVLLGVLWSMWHLPLYFIVGTYQHGLGMGTADFWISMLARVPLAVLLVWLVWGTRGAIVAAVTAHALGNSVGELLTAGRAGPVLELVITASAAATVVIADQRAVRARRRTTP